MPRIIVLILLLAINYPIKAQSLIGNWVGYFSVSSNLGEKTYPYEINIVEVNNQQIVAKTITTFPNQNIVIASAKGNFSTKNQLLNIEETKFDQLRIELGVQTCLMNNLLIYQKNNGRETLEGTFMSKNSIGGNDCGTGKIYLTKDLTFVKNKLPLNKIKSPVKEIKVTKVILKSKDSVHNINIVQSISNTKIASSTEATSNSSLLIFPSESNKFQNNSIVAIPVKKQEDATPIITKQIKSNHEHMIVPWVLISRENFFVKKITTNSKTISFDVFDNGTIDNDTVSIYDNKKLLVDMNKLSYNPIHFDLIFSDNIKSHEIIVVANNLGTVPPNTALIKYKDAKFNEEVFINTDFSKNAKIIIEYKGDKD